MKTLVISFFLFLSLLFVAGICYAGDYYGTGNNAGGGYKSDGQGGLQGTGRNAGSGYRSDGQGGYQGTGRNAGGGYRSGGQGNPQGSQGSGLAKPGETSSKDWMNR